MGKTQKEILGEMLTSVYHSGSITAKELWLLKEQIDAVCIEAKMQEVQKLKEALERAADSYTKV